MSDFCLATFFQLVSNAELSMRSGSSIELGLFFSAINEPANNFRKSCNKIVDNFWELGYTSAHKVVTKHFTTKTFRRKRK